MTTTLRPSGPLQENADGSRVRAYEVRVNSRPVGRVELATETPGGAAVGVIRGLWIERPDRRRGRGTVAALAAEEVLRGWRCRTIRAAVDTGAAEALRMAAALGYTEYSHNMVKRLPAGAPELPEGATGRPMTAGEYDTWLAGAVGSYADFCTAGGLTAEQALARSRADHATALPQGLDTPDTSFTVLEVAGEAVAHVWVRTGVTMPGGATSYVYDVAVAEEHRGRGHGRAVMLLAERAALAGRSRLLGLQVYTDNTPAVRLYRSLGYRTVRHNFKKELI
ncbi:GNAT family N-acetyltransferase [Streptomyces sp. NPDC089919]|uniref:GNAT family N-acetyltransferase n=1 Tax=Streptomyces sp. NPDC089919 TaxID=3155188 RepID=UPI003420453E